MAKKNYDELSKKIIELVGGKDNISFLGHCITRLRFNVKDKGLVKDEELKNSAGIIGCQWVGEQLQVIIGQDVSNVYKAVCKISGIKEEKMIDENLDIKPKFSIASVLDIISGSITPALPLLMGAGFIKVVLLLLTSFNFIDTAGNTYLFLNFVADVPFYFLPVIVGKGAASKFGASESMGMFLGLMLVSPTFIEMVNAGNPLSFLGIPVYMGSYSYLVFPVIISCAVMALVERTVTKFIPKMIQSMFVPFITMLVMIPLSFCLLAPLGLIVGSYLSNFIIWIYDTIGFIGIGLLGAVFPFMIITGMHVAMTPYAVERFSTVGYESLMSPVDTLNNFTQGVACLAIAAKSKNSNIRSAAVSTGFTAIVGGVSEPAIFGFTLKYKTPLYMTALGNLAGGLICGLLSVKHNAMLFGGLFALPAYIGDGMNLVYMILACVVSCVITFVGTYILYKDN